VQNKVRPLPIIVGKVQNYQEMHNHSIKINADEEKDYRDITTALNQTNIGCYSLQNKLTRLIKVMARNTCTHASCSAEDVMKGLQNENFAIMEVSQIRGRKDKTPFPLYMLTFEKKRTQNGSLK
jgi:hypothetical protein